MTVTGSSKKRGRDLAFSFVAMENADHYTNYYTDYYSDYYTDYYSDYYSDCCANHYATYPWCGDWR
ncbi:MAG: hypothetical protein ACRC6D_08765 [Aeromonas sp.]